jgi:Flp pilus assembly pilin Flp
MFRNAALNRAGRKPTGAAGRSPSGFALLRSFLRDRRGAIAVEFAFLLPVQALALAMLTEQQLTFVTEAAARCAAIQASPCLSPEATSAWAAGQIVGVPAISAGNFVVTFDAGCGGVSVVVTYSYSGVILKALKLGAAACYVPEPAK